MRKFIFFKGFTQEWFSSRTVNGQTRTIRAVWTPELDLDIYNGIDAVSELTRIFSEEISAEIDRDILGDLRNRIEEESRYDYNVIPMTLNDILDLDDETDEEVIRGINTLNGGENNDITAMIRELTRTINGGNRA
jgi:hypothetical protein